MLACKHKVLYISACPSCVRLCFLRLFGGSRAWTFASHRRLDDSEMQCVAFLEERCQQHFDVIQFLRRSARRVAVFHCEEGIFRCR